MDHYGLRPCDGVQAPPPTSCATVELVRYWTLSRFRKRVTARHLAALILLGWLNLALQPCSAAQASACVSCPTHGTQDACAAQASGTCATATAIAEKPSFASPACDALVAPSWIASIPSGVPTASNVHFARPPVHAGSDATPLYLRFCSYRN